MSNEDKVREASTQFYAGLNRMLDGDMSQIDAIWSHEETVTAMHPIAGRHLGWDEVRNSFLPVSQFASNGAVELKDQVVRVLGDIAYEVGTESGQFNLGEKTVTIDQRVTNIYQRDGDQWKVIHHHVDLSPSMVEAVNALG